MLTQPETGIFDTGCVNTFFNESPTGWTWLDSTDSQRAIVEIDDTMFSIADGDPWAYKLRVVIYPSCDGVAPPSSSSFFSLSMSCIGCGCEGCDCGAQGCASYESVNGKWTPSGRGQPSGCGAGGGGGGGAPPALRSTSTCPDFLRSSGGCSHALTTTELPPGPWAEVVPDVNGEFMAYAASCCHGRMMSCSVPFSPHFSNAFDSGCASWELMGTCTQDDVTTRMWKPVITSCDSEDGTTCSGSIVSPCSGTCETCCSLCFAVGTRVLLDNGQTRTVEELSVGDRIASIGFGGPIPNPSFTDLLDGWSASPATMAAGSSRVTSVVLGYEQGRTSVGNLITVTPEHPMLVMRKDGDVSFVSASMLADDARLVRPDGSTQAAGSISTISKTTITVSLEMSDATCLVANGVVCHVGTRAGDPSVWPDVGFSVSPAELNAVNAAVVDAVVGEQAASVFVASIGGGNAEATQLSSDQMGDTAKGIVSGGILPEGCEEQCTCTSSCTDPCQDGSMLFGDSYGAMPCCNLNPVASVVASASISPDNLWLMQHVRVSNGADSQSAVVCRPVASLCSSSPAVLSLPSSAGLSNVSTVVSESVATADGHLFVASGGGSVCMGFLHDGMSFRPFGAANYGDGFTVVHSVPTCEPSGKAHVFDLVASGDHSHVSMWSVEDGTTVTRNIVDVLNLSMEFVAVSHTVGGWSACCVGGEGHLAAVGFYPDDTSVAPWSLETPTPINGNGEEMAIASSMWIPFGARDGESIIVIAVPLDGVSDAWPFRARRDGKQLLLQSAMHPISRPVSSYRVHASGLQGKFLVTVDGASLMYEYDSLSGAVSSRESCAGSASPVSCSKSHDLQAVVYGDLERCTGCSGSGTPCNMGAVALGTCGTICTGKQFVVSCEL